MPTESHQHPAPPAAAHGFLSCPRHGVALPSPGDSWCGAASTPISVVASLLPRLGGFHSPEVTSRRNRLAWGRFHPRGSGEKSRPGGRDPPELRHTGPGAGVGAGRGVWGLSVACVLAGLHPGSWKCMARPVWGAGSLQGRGRPGALCWAGEGRLCIQIEQARQPSRRRWLSGHGRAGRSLPGRGRQGWGGGSAFRLQEAGGRRAGLVWGTEISQIMQPRRRPRGAQLEFLARG